MNAATATRRGEQRGEEHGHDERASDACDLRSAQAAARRRAIPLRRRWMRRKEAHELRRTRYPQGGNRGVSLFSDGSPSTFRLRARGR